MHGLSFFSLLLQGKILIGTRDNDIYEINEKSGSHSVVMAAHAEGLLWALDCHPSSSRFLTAGFDKSLRVWDLQNRVSLYFFLSLLFVCFVFFLIIIIFFKIACDE